MSIYDRVVEHKNNKYRKYRKYRKHRKVRTRGTGKQGGKHRVRSMSLRGTEFYRTKMRKGAKMFSRRRGKGNQEKQLLFHLMSPMVHSCRGHKNTPDNIVIRRSFSDWRFSAGCQPRCPAEHLKPPEISVPGADSPSLPGVGAVSFRIPGQPW